MHKRKKIKKDWKSDMKPVVYCIQQDMLAVPKCGVILKVLNRRGHKLAQVGYVSKYQRHLSRVAVATRDNCH